MKRLTKPRVDAGEVFDACVGGITDAALANRLTTARAELVASFNEYELRGGNHRLFSFIASAHGNETQQVLAGITKKEMTDLYTEQMAKERKPGRQYYDRLRMLAPLGKCPLCGFGQVSTLDHFLPKARYPIFSVLCTNLVPSCNDCNKGKGASVITQNSQMLHPYFEDPIIDTEPWLFAEVIESSPATVRYFVQPPNIWLMDLAKRISNYFNDLDLARRFAVEAASEIAVISDQLNELDARDSRQAQLIRSAGIERRNRKNTWRAALYEALAQSDWYLDHGYRNSGPLAVGSQLHTL